MTTKLSSKALEFYNKRVNDYNVVAGKLSGRAVSLITKGIWCIRGEDPNCDLGGHHYMPVLAYFEGTLVQAINWAVEQPKFYTWGSGGEFTLIKVINSEEAAETAKIKAEIKVLEERLAKLNESLK